MRATGVGVGTAHVAENTTSPNRLRGISMEDKRADVKSKDVRQKYLAGMRSLKTNSA